MMTFIMGVIFGGLLVAGSVTIYSIAQMASMYDRNVDRWWDEDGSD